MTPHRWQRIQWILFAVFLCFFVAALLVPEGRARALLVIAAFVVVAVALVGMAVYWRCPACNGFLPTRANGAIAFCPYCGASLDKGHP